MPNLVRISVQFDWQPKYLLDVDLSLTLPKAGGDRLYAEISRGGEVLATLPLDTDAEYIVNGDYENVVTIANGSAFFSSSNCPNEDCVHAGRLTKAGQLAVCLPN